MARYNKSRRPKLKRYRRSFYSREMRLKKGIGIAILVVAVLVAAWLAAPHVLDWATHTWYTVVRDRDLSASSSAASTADSTAASEAAAASQVDESAEETVTTGTEIVEGSWAAVDIAALTSDASIDAAAQRLAAQGAKYALVTLKDETGAVYYDSQVAGAAGGVAATAVKVDPERIATIFKEAGLVPVADLHAFRDPCGARTVRSMAIHYTGQDYLWLDNRADAGGNPWLNPYSSESVQYIGDLVAEVHAAGFDHVLLESVQFPSAQNGRQDFGSTGGVSRADQLTADITAWGQRFGGEVTLWYGYSLTQTTGTSTTLGAPALELGIENLVVDVPASSTLDEAGRIALEQQLADAGVVHGVIRDDAAGSFQ